MNGIEEQIRAVVQTFTDSWTRLHDPKIMASLWAIDGDLINPWGLWGKGRAGVEKIFTIEQTGTLRKSSISHNLIYFRHINPDVVWTEGEARITGALGPKEEQMPPFDHRVFYLFVKMEGKWMISSSRAYQTLGPVTELKV